MNEALQWLYTILAAVMSVVPKVDALWFVAAFAAGFLIVGTNLAIYINVLRGTDEKVLRWILNGFWIYMAAGTVGFILTRQTPLNVLGWFVVCSFAFAFVYLLVMAIRDRLLTKERYSLGWWTGVVLGVPQLIGGFLLDVTFNLTWGRAMFWQKPRLLGHGLTPWQHVFNGDWTLTATLKYNIRTGVELRGDGEDEQVIFLTWQGALAYAICRWYVELVDRGHCGLKPKAV